MNLNLRIATFLLLASISVSAQNILLDESFDDWNEDMLIYEDPAGDAQSSAIDITKVWAANDQTYFYLRFELNKEFNIQSDNDFTLYIDTDSNINTGRKKNGVGAEIEWQFGNRFGRFYEADGDDIFIGHEHIDLMTSPTVSSTQFEIAFRRQVNSFGVQLNIDGNISIRLEDNAFNGDDAPDDLGGFQYNVNNEVNRDFHNYSIDKSAETDIRLMTYNVLADNLFDNNKKDAFRRLFQATQPDIIALQEVRSFDSEESRDIIEEFLPGTWHHSKSGFDIVMVSRYPILQREAIDGNAAFLLDVDGQKMVIINMHLPCCGNNFDRQKESDNIMAYIGKLKTGGNAIQVEFGTPIIITGDSNLVGFQSQQETLITGNILNNAIYGDDIDPDWDGTVLEDAFPFATGTPYTKTWYDPFSSFNSGRLDYIIYTGSALQLRNTFTLSTRDMTLEARQANGLNFGDSENASDHLPTVADFKVMTVGVEASYLDGVDIYPNPINDRINIDLDLAREIEVRVSNPLGQVVKRSTYNDISITMDLSELYTGLYFITIADRKDGSTRSIRVYKL